MLYAGIICLHPAKEKLLLNLHVIDVCHNKLSEKIG